MRLCRREAKSQGACHPESLVKAGILLRGRRFSLRKPAGFAA